MRHLLAATILMILVSNACKARSISSSSASSITNGDDLFLETEKDRYDLIEQDRFWMDAALASLAPAQRHSALALTAAASPQPTANPQNALPQIDAALNQLTQSQTAAKALDEKSRAALGFLQSLNAEHDAAEAKIIGLKQDHMGKNLALQASYDKAFSQLQAALKAAQASPNDSGLLGDAKDKRGSVGAISDKIKAENSDFNTKLSQLRKAASVSARPAWKISCVDTFKIPTNPEFSAQLKYDVTSADDITVNNAKDAVLKWGTRPRGAYRYQAKADFWPTESRDRLYIFGSAKFDASVDTPLAFVVDYKINDGNDVVPLLETLTLEDPAQFNSACVAVRNTPLINFVNIIIPAPALFGSGRDTLEMCQDNYAWFSSNDYTSLLVVAAACTVDFDQNSGT